MQDRYGLPLSTTSVAARDAYVAGVDRLLAALPGADEALDAAIAEDPAFCLAHVARARVLQLGNRIAEARASIDRACELAAGTSAREQGQTAIFARLLHGRGPEALALMTSHLGNFPRDAVALSPSVGVFGLFGFSGRADREAALAALLDSLAVQYGEDWWFLSAHAFALVENGRAAAGRERVERSLALKPRNANAAHIHAHALYELAEDAAAAVFLDTWLPDYSVAGPLHCHLSWHLALIRMFEGDADGMWDVYARYCTPGRALGPPINVVTDGVSLLWRASLAGMACERTHWEALRTYCEAQFPTPGIFVDVHYGLCLAALGDAEALRHYLATLNAAADAGQLLAGPVVAAIVEAADAWLGGDRHRVIRLLSPRLDEVVRIGGSRAQRDLIGNTLIAAHLALGDAAAARQVLARRGPRAGAMPIAGLPQAVGHG